MRNPGRNATLWLMALLLLATPTLGANDEKARLKVFSTEMKGANARERIALIKKLTAEETHGAAGAISRYMTDRDADVRKAAIEAEGALRDGAMLGKLLSLTKTYEKDPNTLATVVRAVGRFESPKALKTLKSISRKWLPRDAGVASAAAEALGQIPDRSSVELLIRMLEQTDPRLPSTSSKDISLETRRILRESKSSIIAALQHLTCWDFRDSEAWQRFWKAEQRRWKHAPCDRDLSELSVWRDPGYGFTVKRPGEGWSIERTSTRKDYRVYFERRGAGGAEAAVWVYAHSDRGGLTPSIKAEERLDLHMDRMKDIKTESISSKNTRVAGRSGHRLSFTGLDAGGSAVHVEERFVVSGGMMFIVGSWRRTGLSDDVESEVQKALDSFTVFD